MDDEKEIAELKNLMVIIPDVEEVAIDAIPLAIKSLRITKFEPHVEDAVWRKQEVYKVLEWNLYDSYGVHSLRMQSMHIYMLVEKKYPLTPSTLTMMLQKKLQIDSQSEMAYQLLRVNAASECYYCQYKVTTVSDEVNAAHGKD
uniref:Uncharacterized protein n=1 Tax=Tanacetum cinerariifolium TaxID=118510 RepID=A0A6L2NP91_TANCI|nr:hypothetical protein [Tanacetum cinerariifolium]